VEKEILALGITVLVHVVGLGALIWMLMLGEEQRPDWRSWWPGRDDERPSGPTAPEPSGGGIPLPDGAPSAVRLRQPARLRTGYAAPARRPAHPPERVPEHVPDPERAPR
jgi:hypothetical protein